MSFADMSQTRQRAWLAAVVWSVAGVGFFVTFFMGGGAAGFPAESGRHLAGAVALAIGFLGYWLSLWLTRRRRDGPPRADERDLQVAARANQATLIVVSLGIFVFTITLWAAYEATGSVPVGWMWLLAYGEVILASVTSAIATLVLDGKTSGHA